MEGGWMVRGGGDVPYRVLGTKGPPSARCCPLVSRAFALDRIHHSTRTYALRALCDVPVNGCCATSLIICTFRLSGSLIIELTPVPSFLVYFLYMSINCSDQNSTGSATLYNSVFLFFKFCPKITHTLNFEVCKFTFT